jgi:hypothetical protein
VQSARKFSVWRKSRSRSGIISVSTSFFRSRVASFRPNDATFQSKNALRLSQRRRGHGQSLWRLVSLQSGKKGKKTTDRSIGVDHPTIVPVRFLIVSRTRSLRDDVRAELTHVTRNSFFIVVSIPVIRALRIVVVVYRSLIRRQIIIIVSNNPIGIHPSTGPASSFIACIARRRASSSGSAYRHLDASGRLTADLNVKKAHRVRHGYVVPFVPREWKSVERVRSLRRFSCTRGVCDLCDPYVYG